MGSGGIKDSQNQLKGISSQEQATSAALGKQGQSLIAEGQAQQSPLVDFLHKIIGGDATTTSQALAPVIGNITAGTTANRENIFSHTAPGAGRDVLLGENERGQGTAVAQATNQTFLQAFPELASLAGANTQAGLGLTGAGITSLGNAGTTTSNVLNSQEQQKAQTIGIFTSLASAAGEAAGGGAFGKICWVAEAIYGVDDMRTHLVRAYLIGPFRETRFGRMVVALYAATGRQIAWLARRSPWLRNALQPLFDRVLRNAMSRAVAGQRN